ncbi:unnamed protein product [Rangifer tarandus platyrhynchus]|uniref:Uncharacterized protein n=1 Tax=Rangifer tarandus platyrhynchus TaxID=3082113 RepID=A0ABN8Y9B4_RANTA|nr:unnamed protein product [Rangifer tarandus platyrhynchus]
MLLLRLLPLGLFGRVLGSEKNHQMETQTQNMSEELTEVSFGVHELGAVYPTCSALLLILRRQQLQHPCSGGSWAAGGRGDVSLPISSEGLAPRTNRLCSPGPWLTPGPDHLFDAPFPVLSPESKSVRNWVLRTASPGSWNGSHTQRVGVRSDTAVVKAAAEFLDLAAQQTAGLASGKMENRPAPGTPLHPSAWQGPAPGIPQSMAIASQALDVSEVAANSLTPAQLSLEVKLISPGLPFRLHGALDFLSSHAEAVVKSGPFLPL